MLKNVLKTTNCRHLYSERGKTFAKRGHLYNKRGETFIERGHLYNERGHLYNERGHLYNERGHLYIIRGHIIAGCPLLIVFCRFETRNDRLSFVIRNPIL